MRYSPLARLRRLLLAAGDHLAERLDQLGARLLRTELTGLLGTQQLLSLLLDLLRRHARRVERLGNRLRDALAEGRERIADDVERAADHAAHARGQQVDRDQQGDGPGQHSVDDAIATQRHAGQARRDVAADDQGDQIADHPPDAGAEAEARGSRRVSGGRIDRRQADAEAEQTERDLDGDHDDGAGQNGAPGDSTERGRGDCHRGSLGTVCSGANCLGHDGHSHLVV